MTAARSLSASASQPNAAWHSCISRSPDESVARHNTEECLKAGRSGVEAPDLESEGRRRRQGRWIDPLPTASQETGVAASDEAADVAEARATAALGFLSPSGSRLETASWDVVPQVAPEPFKIRWPTLPGLSTSPIPLSPSQEPAGFQFRGECLRPAVLLKVLVAREVCAPRHSLSASHSCKSRQRPVGREEAILLCLRVLRRRRKPTL